MISNAADARKFLVRAVKASRAEEVIASLSGSVAGNLRWAVNEVTTSGDIERVTLWVTSAFGKKHASARTDRLDERSIEETVRRSESMARLMPEDPEWVGVLGPQKYASVAAYKKGTVEFGADARAAGIAGAIDAVKAEKLSGAGFFSSGEHMVAIMSSKGLFAFHRETDAQYTTTVRTTDGSGSGWAGARDPDASAFDLLNLTRRAIGKGRDSAKPRELPPGRYPVIFEASATGSMLAQLMWGLSRRSADEGRSAFSKGEGSTKVGARLFSPKVSVYSEPADPALLSRPFDGSGLSLERHAWIEEGVLEKLHVGRYWAQKKGIEPTGFPSGFLLKGGSRSLAEIIADTDRAVLVTRLWYIRMIDPRTLTVTGLTRDGTFWVEKGKIVHPVKNFRFNDSPISFLDKIEVVGKPKRLTSGWGRTIVVAPPVRASEFNFASLSDAV